MSKPPLLVQLAEDLEEGFATVDEVVECSQRTLSEARLQQEQMHRSLANEDAAVRELVSPELRCAEASFEDFLRLADCGSAQPESMRRIVDGLGAASLRLQVDLTRLSEAVWLARGPSTLSGLNRILWSAEAEQDIRPWVLLEDERWKQPEPAHPPPLRSLVTRFAEKYRLWLQAFEDSGKAWQAKGRALGAEFARFDLDYLWRRHSGGPTPYGLLNLVVNATWLRAGGHIEPLLSAYCIEMLSEEVLRIESESLEGQASPEQWEARQELVELGHDLQDVLNHLRNWNDNGDATRLEKLRTLAIELGHELYELLDQFPQGE